MGQARDRSDAGAGVPPPRLPAPLASLHTFDKAFPVLLHSDHGVANGVGRNISAHGMFVETREPCPMGTEVRVTFAAGTLGTEIVAVGEVRFQCYLNYSGGSGNIEGMRGMGLRFLRFEEPERSPRGSAVTH